MRATRKSFHGCKSVGLCEQFNRDRSWLVIESFKSDNLSSQLMINVVECFVLTTYKKTRDC